MSKSRALLNHAAAGRVLEKRILAQAPTLTKWALEHTLFSNGQHLGVTTAVRVCAGTYNAGSGISVELLWRIAMLLTDSEDAAKMLALEYLTELCLVPRSSETTLAAQLAAVKVPLDRIAHASAILAATAKHKAQKEKES